MSKKRLNVDWSNVTKEEDYSLALKRFSNYLRDRGLRKSTIGMYVGCARRYLQFAQTERPSKEDSLKFRESLLENNLSRSSVNNYSFAIKNYHEMLGDSIKLPFLKKNDEIPYYFDEDDVLRIFSVCHNIKHLAMLQTAFYGCLRASELCNLDDGDVDLKNLTLRIREGKGGRDGIVFISNECAATLRRYLEVRAQLEVDGNYPLFYTDFGKRWDRKDFYRMFITYKKKAGIEKTGGVHVFARHTPATIMIAKGCDIRIVKEVLRHRDIRTTLRYAHVADKTKRVRYEQYLVL
ncbi:MAG TPA: tyrosine-type recombinase/integrase [Alphaproteobacteria bacterium]|nr:tyrosine-type recombinase/integrase [Alphaproteobacteria bacterium]